MIIPRCQRWTFGHWVDFAYPAVSRSFLSMWAHLVIHTPGITKSVWLLSLQVKDKLRVDSKYWLYDQCARIAPLSYPDSKLVRVCRRCYQQSIKIFCSLHAIILSQSVSANAWPHLHSIESVFLSALLTELCCKRNDSENAEVINSKFASFLTLEIVYLNLLLTVDSINR